MWTAWASLSCSLSSLFKDAYAKGEIVLGTKAEGYDVTSGCTEREPPHGYGFEITTPHRKYELSAASEEERDEWIEVLNDVISVSLSAVDRDGKSLIYMYYLFMLYSWK
jgi:hypothetical protein